MAWPFKTPRTEPVSQSEAPQFCTSKIYECGYDDTRLADWIKGCNEPRSHICPSSHPGGDVSKPVFL